MPRADTNEDAQALALRALVWTLAEPERALRLLSVTGLTPGDLRARVGDADVLGAALGFLESHEPDLIACANALDVTPEALVRAHHALET
ncbi:MAG TPA: DUF3572 domain-containing protein [Sphingomonas sp.]|jgi:hypothetical protein|nr:DUF3572 domain-containing protein [Sphingomonas sp.]